LLSSFLSSQRKVKAQEILSKGSNGVLSTIGEEGCPYGVPLNYIYLDNCIGFHCALQGLKLDNINFNEKVSFCAVTQSDVLGNEFDTAYESAIAFGTATVVADDSEKEDMSLSVLKIYSADYLKAGSAHMKKHWGDTKVVKINIDHRSAKAHE
jgi:nitroimidazol reductase NimA-like FMN-containing flavoprotein (pyridoxamine 5'-phosphate oxidase superfamily)